MKEWSSLWKSSTKPAKQRKYRHNAPKHLQGKFLHAPLAKPLRASTKRRSIRVRTGDLVKVLRGQFKGKTGKVERVDPEHEHIYITGIEMQKKDGSKTTYPLHASKIIIQELDTTNKKRLS